MNTCKKCENSFSGNYCPHCGTPTHLARINGAYIAREIGSVFTLDKGIFYTIRELLLRPGVSIRIFLLEDRNRLVKPVIFLILSSLIYSLAQQLLHFEDGYIRAEAGNSSAVTTIFGWIQSNYGYANILMGIIIALWAKILFRKTEFNFYEILILIFFVMGIAMLIYTLFGIAESFTHVKMLHIGGLSGIAYAIWAMGKFFYPKKIASYVKALCAYFLGWLTSIFFAIGIGELIDLLT